jgi:hypothetical protein
MQTQLRLIKFHDALPKALKISPSPQRPSFPHVYHLQYVMITIHLTSRIGSQC